MSKQALLAIGTTIGGLALCAGIIALQGGALTGGGTVYIPPAESSAPIPAPIPTLVAEVEEQVDEEPEVKVRKARREVGDVRSPRRVKPKCVQHSGSANVTVCDSQPRAKLPEPEYKKSGQLIPDYRQDFLEALED
jgi:hypothetical protein